jgi:hypothetical protein
MKSKSKKKTKRVHSKTKNFAKVLASLESCKRNLEMLLADLYWRRKIRGLQLEMLVTQNDLKVVSGMVDGPEKTSTMEKIASKINDLGGKLAELKSWSDNKILSEYKKSMGMTI